MRLWYTIKRLLIYVVALVMWATVVWIALQQVGFPRLLSHHRIWIWNTILVVMINLFKKDNLSCDTIRSTTPNCLLDILFPTIVIPSTLTISFYHPFCRRPCIIILGKATVIIKVLEVSSIYCLCTLKKQPSYSVVTLVTASSCPLDIDLWGRQGLPRIVLAVTGRTYAA